MTVAARNIMHCGGHYERIIMTTRRTPSITLSSTSMKANNACTVADRLQDFASYCGWCGSKLGVHLFSWS